MNDPASPTNRADTLTEQQFEHCYRHALRFRNQGLLEAARDTYLLLFDRGREVGGFGVTRLSFVVNDLMVVLGEIAAAGEPTSAGAAPSTESESPFAPVEARRNLAEERICTGKGGFVDAQEVVALNRALGQSDRSAELYRSLAPDDAGGNAGGDKGQDRSGERSQHDSAIAAARQTLGDLIWQDLAPTEPPELARQASSDPVLWSRVVALARQVAWWIAELRVREDFPGDTWVYRDTYLRWLATRIETDGILAFRMLLAMARFRPPAADPPLADATLLATRLQGWLLAFRPDVSTLTALTAAARNADRPDLVDRLQEEAWSLLDADDLRGFARASAGVHGEDQPLTSASSGLPSAPMAAAVGTA